MYTFFERESIGTDLELSCAAVEQFSTESFLLLASVENRLVALYPFIVPNAKIILLIACSATL